MQSVLLNIIINALDATDPGEVLPLRAVSGYPRASPGQNGVEILCTDTGVDSLRTSIAFRPFLYDERHRTRHWLGLSVSYGIVERHGGTSGSRARSGREAL